MSSAKRFSVHSIPTVTQWIVLLTCLTARKVIDVLKFDTQQAKSIDQSVVLLISIKSQSKCSENNGWLTCKWHHFFRSRPVRYSPCRITPSAGSLFFKRQNNALITNKWLFKKLTISTVIVISLSSIALLMSTILFLTSLFHRSHIHFRLSCESQDSFS